VCRLSDFVNCTPLSTLSLSLTNTASSRTFDTIHSHHKSLNAHCASSSSSSSSYTFDHNIPSSLFMSAPPTLMSHSCTRDALRIQTTITRSLSHTHHTCSCCVTSVRPHLTLSASSTSLLHSRPLNHRPHSTSHIRTSHFTDSQSRPPAASPPRRLRTRLAQCISTPGSRPSGQHASTCVHRTAPTNTSPTPAHDCADAPT
jgi:hypothetical protein